MSTTSVNDAPPSTTTTITTINNHRYNYHHNKAPTKTLHPNQIPSTILNNPSLNAAISLLPSNYNFEIHKSVHLILSLNTRSKSTMKAVLKAKEAKSWGIVLGTLGRQGNLRILERLERKMEERGTSWTVVLMSEMSLARIALFEDSIDAWIQIDCPMLSIDWGEAFERPLLNPLEAEIALGLIRVWWENEGCGVGVDCGGNEGSCRSCGCDYGTKVVGLGMEVIIRWIIMLRMEETGIHVT